MATSLFLIYLLSSSTSLSSAYVDGRLLHSRFLTTAGTESDLVSIRNLSNLDVNLSLNASSGSLLTPLLIERVSGSAGNAMVQAYISSVLGDELGWSIELDAFKDVTPYGEKPFTNIIATFNPNASHKVVLAAHFDSKYFESGAFIGATDSAVPCAMLLDLARALTPLLKRQATLNQNAISDTTMNTFALGTSTTLQLIFFDGEEAFKQWTATDSLYGARHLAAKWEEAHILQSISLFVLLDLLGAPNPTFVNMNANTEWAWNRFAEINDRLNQYNLLSNTKSKSYNTYTNPRYFRVGYDFRYAGGVEDDHIPFQRRGVPVAHVIAVPFPTVWHTLHDDGSALDLNVIKDLALIFRVFVFEFLGLSV
ncbi:hypothetical protein SeMB42_g02384 [Synchytrium endobioticum]|uniref:Peptide hydrolase n=1 Tax=Synchytrium endobioticum TaxID=286115 RepID=A0A507DEH4_9FUNG|nr:hypothetical protein SeLEV6574_g02673 [Synchytrium endobioticum]TPX50099.1 hypothetical protein SeMB42_g02384 [Synchytrium endobioticum]